MKEVYCSFEVAKLLKEKRFNISLDSNNWLCCMYDENGNIQWGIYDENWYFRITHQMAMKWLREECEVYIDIETCYEYTNRNENFKVTGFAFTTHTKDDPCYDDDNSFDSYEEACEAALKYSLENLI